MTLPELSEKARQDISPAGFISLYSSVCYVPCRGGSVTLPKCVDIWVFGWMTD